MGSRKILYTCVEVSAMIGERLAEVRKDHKDTQDTLAERLGVSRFTVSSWEQEKSAPSHEDLVRICRLYNVSSDYLLGLTRIERPEDFTREELAQIREFEEFLMWKRKSKRK